MSTQCVPAAAGSASTPETDPVSPLVGPQCSTSSTTSVVPDYPQEEVLVGTVDQLPSSLSKKSKKEEGNTEEILDLLKTDKEHIRQMLELIDNTLSTSNPDLKRSWCLCMEASGKDIRLSLWRSYNGQSYLLITQFIDQSAALKQVEDV